MLDPRIKRIIEWLAENAAFESGLLYHDPQAYVLVIPLLDEIVATYEVEMEEVGNIFLLVGCNWQEFEKLRHILVGSGLIIVSGHYCTLTEKGKGVATKINETLAGAKS